MTYILMTCGLFLLPIPIGRRAALSHLVYVATLCGLFIFSAFRFEVGYDWPSYFVQYQYAGSLYFSWSMEIREPLWWGALYIIHSLGLPYPFANVVSSAIFFGGVHILARRQPNPLAFIVLLFPILIINMPMSALRQGAAIGLICVAFTRFIDKKPLRFALWVIIASGFHSSASVFLILLPLVMGSYTRRRLFMAGVLAIPGAYFLASGDVAEHAFDAYVDSGLEAAGAAFRLGILFLSGLYFFLFLRKAWCRQFPEDFPLAHLFSMAMISLIALLPLSSVIGDRLGYYLIPLQAMIFARIPVLEVRYRKVKALLPYVVLLIIFTTWVSLSWRFQDYYIPYRSWLFGFYSDFWSGR